MNKRGYTLIELLAVVIIIIMVATIVALNFDTILGKSNNKKIDSFDDDLERAACVFIDLRENASIKNSCYPSSCQVTVEQLITSGLILDDVVDPSTNQKVNKNLTIGISWDENGIKTCTLNR